MIKMMLAVEKGVGFSKRFEFRVNSFNDISCKTIMNFADSMKRLKINNSTMYGTDCQHECLCTLFSFTTKW